MTQHRFYKDKYGYLLESGHADEGRGDAIARTILAAIVYREVDFIKAIYDHFWKFIIWYHWNPQRHPEDSRKDFSRDHTIWFVIYLRYFHEIDLKKSLFIPYRISQKFTMGIYVCLWIRALTKGWFWNFLHWAVAGIWLRAMKWWNNWLLKRAKIQSVYYRDYKVTPESELTRKEWQARHWMFRAEYIDTLAFQVHILNDGWFKERLKKRVLDLAERENYLIQRLMGDSGGWDKYLKLRPNNYSGMTMYRWNKRLDKTNPWDMECLSGEQPLYNLDVDVLHANLNWK